MYDSVYWSDLGQGQVVSSLNVVMNLQVPRKPGNVLTRWGAVSVSKNALQGGLCYSFSFVSYVTYLLTHSMVQSPSCEANWFAASQEIPRILWNPKVHYRTHKRPPPVPVLGRPNPVHIPTPHLLEIHPNIIHPSAPRSPQWSLPSGFPTKTLYTPLSSPIRTTFPAHLILVMLSLLI